MTQGARLSALSDQPASTDKSSSVPERSLAVARQDRRNAPWNGATRIAGQTPTTSTSSCPPGHVLVNGVTTPEPMRRQPAMGSEYWVAAPLNARFTFSTVWRGDPMEKIWLSRGFIHATEAAARAHAQALIVTGAQQEA